MEIKKTAIAGTLESSDIQVTVSKGNDGIKIDLTSDVKERFGRILLKQLKKLLTNLELKTSTLKQLTKVPLIV